MRRHHNLRRTLYLLFLSQLLFPSAILHGEQNASIDILHTGLNLYVKSYSPDLHGDVHYTSLIEEPGNLLLTFNSYWLSIDSAHVDGNRVSVAEPFDPRMEEFQISLPPGVSRGDSVIISLWYSRIPADIATGREVNRGGYYFFERDSSLWNDIAPQTIAYTMSQPNDARAWFPCIDKPSNKSTLTFRITLSHKNGESVPVRVIANGELTDIFVDEETGSETYVYEHPYPIPPYLMAFYTGPFISYETVYRSISGRELPVVSYLLDQDEEKADRANDYMVNMLGIFEELFGEYPYERYGMIELAPFRWNGMEHQTITAMRRGVYTNELIIAHELAHHWWGNLVTCESWKDIWLNEGFATYSEAIYQERVRGVTARDELLAFFARQYFEDDSVNQRYSLYDPPAERLFGRTIYRKGAWVLHMLRGLIGDRSFFESLNEYASEYKYSAATTEGFRAVVEDVYGDDLEWFFSQWVYDSGYPVYSYTAETNEKPGDEGVDIKIYLSQIQQEAPEVFHGPVDFRVVSGDGDTTVTFWNDRREQEFGFIFHTLPDTIIFDPENKILKKAESPKLSVKDDTEIPESVMLYQNYPNPFNETTMITYYISESADVRLDIVDVTGRLVDRLAEGYLEPGIYRVTFNAKGFASGIYFAVLSAGERSLSRKMMYLK